MKPIAGEAIHGTDIGKYDLDGFRLSWNPDNTARVSAIEQPDIPGAVRCCRYATCKAAYCCAAGKPHRPNREMDAAGSCYDHQPHIDGGIVVWGEVVNAKQEEPQ